MVIKKKTLIIICAFLSIMVIGGVVLIRKQKEERAKQELLDKYNRAVEREFDSLVREYNSIIEVIQDYDYSESFRWKYVIKLDKLLGTNKYRQEYEYSMSMSAINVRIRNEREEDLSSLRMIAHQNILSGE